MTADEECVCCKPLEAGQDICEFDASIYARREDFTAETAIVAVAVERILLKLPNMQHEGENSTRVATTPTTNHDSILPILVLLLLAAPALRTLMKHADAPEPVKPTIRPPTDTTKERWALFGFPRGKQRQGAGTKQGIQAQHELLRSGESYSSVLLVNCGPRSQVRTMDVEE